MKIGIIGGSGLEDPNFINGIESKKVSTPYGDPSSSLILGFIDHIPIVTLSRHGTDHSKSPTNINYRANIFALKNEGCTHVIAATACGSLRESIKPGDFVFPDQFIDKTTKRVSTYFDKDEVQHVSMGNPFSDNLRSCLEKICKVEGFNYHNGGTVITIEGPRFSTKAESMLFRSWGCDIINMTTVPEVILAKELDLEYQNIAMSTDYDCWRDNEQEVNMEMIYAVMKQNAKNLKKLIKKVIPLLKEKIN